MTPRNLLTAFALAATLACASSTDPIEVEGWESFGAGISASEPMQLHELLAASDSLNGEHVVLEATVLEVCPKKGCWMTFDTGAAELRVTFLDYGFFVPLDIAGRTVRVEGIFEEAEVPLAEAQHYLEDAGRHEEAAALTGPQKGYRLVASGVLLEDTEE
ncbi:MAG: hypothetical protein DHS20C15_26380 [Planctomycetota bacterium]|nr:MAG: hypothetical protein DHS20C15_26380 [Planctomycetota bacterium]